MPTHSTQETLTNTGASVAAAILSIEPIPSVAVPVATSVNPIVGLTTLGSAMPDLSQLPVLTEMVEKRPIGLPEQTTVGLKQPPQTKIEPKPGQKSTQKVCKIEQGLTFSGNITLQGLCTISGNVLGNLHEDKIGTSQVILTETGVVKGDIFSSKVSVMGTCNGTIDASGGMVELHAKSVVTGHIRYGQLQVNGADLNATLERVLTANKNK